LFAVPEEKCAALAFVQSPAVPAFVV